MADTVTFLGTSDGLPSPDRHHAALYLQLDGHRLLLDCGEPCSHTLKSMRVDFDAIDAVIITHTHSDHVAGFPMLVQSMWLEHRRRTLPVWMPGHAVVPLRRWLESCYLFPETCRFTIQWRPLSTRSRIRLGNVRVRAFRTTHLDHARDRLAKRHPAVGFDAHSLLIETGVKRVVYSADLGRPEDLKPLLTQPVDILVTELAHFDPKALFAVLVAHDIRRIAVTHAGRPVRQQIKAVRQLARTMLPGRDVRFVNDGDVLTF
jgi:ribonuclease BN (tRNA processing enzyme)